MKNIITIKSKLLLGIIVSLSMTQASDIAELQNVSHEGKVKQEQNSLIRHKKQLAQDLLHDLDCIVRDRKLKDIEPHLENTIKYYLLDENCDIPPKNHLSSYDVHASKLREAYIEKEHWLESFSGHYFDCFWCEEEAYYYHRSMTTYNTCEIEYLISYALEYMKQYGNYLEFKHWDKPTKILVDGFFLTANLTHEENSFICRKLTKIYDESKVSKILADIKDRLDVLEILRKQAHYTIPNDSMESPIEIFWDNVSRGNSPHIEQPNPTPFQAYYNRLIPPHIPYGSREYWEWVRFL